MYKKYIGFFVVLMSMGSLLSGCGNSTADENAKDLIKGFNTKARIFINQPGWVHVTENIVYDTDKENRGEIANGTPIPLVQVVDIWYHINESKLVYQYVWTMSSQGGTTIEVVVFLHDNVFNLTTNASNPMNPYSLGSLDYQFADEMDYFITNSGKHPVISTVDMSGKTATVFTLNERLDSPRTTEDFTQPITAIGSIAYFDEENGLLLKLERTVTLADGSKRVFYTDNITVETGVEPPLIVQNYVNGFW